MSSQEGPLADQSSPDAAFPAAALSRGELRGEAYTATATRYVVWVQHQVIR